ncbi:MAG TPA: phosphatase PAP2-related protein [Myxococcaceae bacterium]|nr:phosphatase PAP2-related protein [Myxococcaceae bacterium]
MPDTPSSSAARAWTDAWAEPRFRREALLTAAGMLLVLTALARFLNWVERRPGVVLPDPVLAVLAPRDLTWITFALIYAGILTAVAVLLPTPRRLVLGFQAYVGLVLLRMAVMAVTPLEAPPGMVLLRDPLVQLLGTGQPLTKDLFFSGHTSTLFLLTLMAPGRGTRAFFLACTVAVAGCVLWQHVHYTVDVLVAPLFAFASHALVVRLQVRRSLAADLEEPAPGRARAPGS